MSARSAVAKGPGAAKSAGGRRVPPVPAPALRGGKGAVLRPGAAGPGVAEPFGRADVRRQEFEEVTLPHMERLFQFARRLTRSHEEAQDVVQETYLRAWRFFHRFEKGTNARAWLYRILHNVFLNLRKPGRQKEVQMPEDEGMDDFLLYTHMVRDGGWKDPLDVSPEKFNHMFGDEVKRALDRLPDVYRFPLLLCDVEGMSYENIAKVLGVPGGTVRSRLFRGRAVLQKDLVEYARKQGILKEKGRT